MVSLTMRMRSFTQKTENTPSTYPLLVCTLSGGHYYVSGKNMLIHVTLRSGRKLTLEVERKHTIANVKKLIEDKEGVPPEDQKLLFNGDSLEDDLTLSVGNIPEESTLYLVQRLSVFVVLPEGRKIIINMEADETIMSLKVKIYDREGTRPDEQRLLFHGTELTVADHDKRLIDCDIRSGSTIHLVLRLPGGEVI